MTEHNVEKDEPWCKGSMRDPLYSTDVNGKPWGKCRACTQYVPMVPHRPITKMHRDRRKSSLPPDQ